MCLSYKKHRYLEVGDGICLRHERAAERQVSAFTEMPPEKRAVKSAMAIRHRKTWMASPLR